LCVQQVPSDRVEPVLASEVERGLPIVILLVDLRTKEHYKRRAVRKSCSEEPFRRSVSGDAHWIIP
jgi:hypothetical protein